MSVYSIGLTLLAVTAILQEYDCLGSVLFSLSLNFKQMSLYHAPVFFIVLLRKCYQRGYGARSLNKKHSIFPFLKYLVCIGGTVIVTFGILWVPFCMVPSTTLSGTCGATLLQILHRIFPFSRGIFEDKVANLWYLSSVIYDYRLLVPQIWLVRVSLVLTLLLLAPVMYSLGKYEATPVRFLLGLVVSALGTKFQMYEYTI